MRRVWLLTALLSASAVVAAPITAPVDVGVGPVGVWWYGRLLDNRGAIPQFGLTFNVHAVIDEQLIRENLNKLPAQYRSMASGIKSARISPSIFIPSTLIISPAFDRFAGMFGVTWTPIGLTLVSTGQKSEREWNKSRGQLLIDANALLTYLFVYSLSPEIPTTHFLRPGLELKLTLQVNLTRSVLLSFGGGSQVYIPQKLGSFFELGPLADLMWLNWYAFLKLHVRFPYVVNL